MTIRDLRERRLKDIEQPQHLQDVDGYTVQFLKFGQDIDGTPLLKGLPGDHCSCPHWGYRGAEANRRRDAPEYAGNADPLNRGVSVRRRGRVRRGPASCRYRRSPRARYRQALHGRQRSV